MPRTKRKSPDGMIHLRIPQARVLRALYPQDPDEPEFEWPLMTRAVMAVCAGYTPISGSITRALIGIHEGSSSGDAHLGLIPLGLVEIVDIDVDGVKEVNYRITKAGIEALKKFILSGGILPPVKDATAHTNARYTREG